MQWDAQSSQSGTSVESDDEQLRSYFDEETKGCTAFRILLIGKSGSGKTTLVNEVFDLELALGNDFTVRAAANLPGSIPPNIPAGRSARHQPCNSVLEQQGAYSP
jgi:septin family protein